MRKYEKRIIPSEEKDVLVETSCDLCGKIAKNGGWESSTYEVNEVDVSVSVHHNEGTVYPDGDGWGTKINVDMCPDCFRNVLVPFLNEKGANVQIKEWEC